MWIDLIAYSAAAVLLVPVAVVCVECLAAFLPANRDQSREQRQERGSAAVLVPAHDEQEGVGRTVESIKRDLRDGDRVVVIADNCSDSTARVARNCGAEVVERFDDNRRGKGFALDAGLQYLGDNSPAFVMMIDADTDVVPGTIDALAEQVTRTARPAQAINLLEA